MKRIVCLLLMICTAVMVSAQRKIIVLDAETYEPVEGVSIWADSMEVVKTNGQGIVFVKEPFDSLTFSHLKYGRERLAAKEVADTMLMFAHDMELPEVVVMAVSPELTKSIRSSIKRMVSEIPQNSGASFDFANLLDKRGRRDRKHLKRAKKILQDYDQGVGSKEQYQGAESKE